MMQWWYGHNAVGFFLTAGFLGMMYYFVPKQANPPGVFVPAVGGALLGAHRHLHVGGSAPSPLHVVTGLGTDHSAMLFSVVLLAHHRGAA